LYNISANTNFKGKSLIYLPTCHSTNAYARELLISQNPAEGTLIITPDQTNGKGQAGAYWESEIGQNLTFSLILRPTMLQAHQQFYLSIITAMAVRDCVAYFLNKEIKIKWPNDIYLNNSKIAGILIENTLKGSVITTSIIGIGLNVNQLQFSDKKAISMRNCTQTAFDHTEVLSKLLYYVDGYYTMLRKGVYESLAKAYTEYLYQLNIPATFKKGDTLFDGKIMGVDESGRLQIVTKNGVELFNNKEVSFIFC
jgi:BirA family transcriptional regulator, biotin operon repressor / biotin---[acetyl-CoA-carboxylase] ligase